MNDIELVEIIGLVVDALKILDGFCYDILTDGAP